MREPQGEKVRALVLFEQSVDMSAVASICTIQLHEKAAKEKERFRGKNHEPPWNQKRRLDSVGNSFFGRYTVRRL